MKCNIDLHDELVESGEIYCPFCDQTLDSNEKQQNLLVKYDLCCDYQDFINKDDMLVCQSCGVVQGYNFVEEYIDFYENRQIYKKICLPSRVPYQ